MISAYGSLIYELKKKWKGIYEQICCTGPSSYEKRIYQAAVSQRLRNTALEGSSYARWDQSS